ncbi:hypothetical protein [Nonomuraea deserti]|uniref:hypothetical protein n=1 Tax=Nonomuraea deserti TaxID=1848322 RepID=UPI0014044D4E|nr:hypothetical protein [Nonomuraea deserti]
MLTYWPTVVAARGARWAHVRVCIISIVMPFAIAAIAVVAFIINESNMRAGFPKAR